MSFRSRETLEGWLADFRELGYPADPAVRVIEQDGADGANTGLVAVQLSSGLAAYIQPDGAPGRWAVTLEARENTTELGAAEVSRLAAELTTVSALCAYLQARSAGAQA